MNLAPAFGFIERHGAALTELDCKFWSQNDAADRALAWCARLESLTNAEYYNAKVWLGLTHLHTLCGVDLGVVSAAAIAAALPRLHTLSAFIPENSVSPVPHTAVAGFFEDLVPRLRVLHFRGVWPNNDPAPLAIVPKPLPLLQELSFCCFSGISVENAFIRAQPLMLIMPHAAVTNMLRAASLMPGEATHQPLARVRDLRLVPGFYGGGIPPNPSDVARLLRAAPQLRNFNGSSLEGGFDWLDDPAFTGLVHPWLRSVRVLTETCHADPPLDWAVQLRRLHFPRLQQLIINSTQHLVHDE
jgi:hypothetical protein